MAFSPDQKTADAGRSRYREFAFLFLVIAVASAVAYYGAVFVYQALHQGRPQDAAAGDPRLVISDEELNLGRVHETTVHDHQFHITNPGDRPVTITRFERTCDCLGITPGEGVTLEPHETKTFDIKLSLVSRPGSASHAGGGHSRPVSARFTR